MKNRNLKKAVAGSDKTNYQIELEGGLPLTKLSRIIHGAAQPSESEKDAIARALGTKVTELFPSPSDPVAA